MGSGINSNLVDRRRAHVFGFRQAAGGSVIRVPRGVCLALYALGAASTIGWAPLEQIWIAWLAFAVLAASVACAGQATQAGLRSLCFALGLHMAGHGWVFGALLKQTEAGVLWSLLGSTLFLIYLASFLAVPVLVCRGVPEWTCGSRRRIRNVGTASVWVPAALAVTWTSGEALRGSLFNGFDSLAAGYLFTVWPLRGWIPVVGVYGCSLLFYMSASVAGTAWALRRQSILVWAALSVIPVALVLVGGAALDTRQWVTAVGPPLSFRLIQGGVQQSLKFDALENERHVNAYIEAISAEPADLIITPETALAGGWMELHPSVLEQIRSFTATTGSHVFVGMPHVEVGGLIKNSVFQIPPNHSSLPRYDKSRLMPFGEYAPAGLAWFTQRMSVPLNDQTAGSVDQPPFVVSGGTVPVRVGTLICHEDLSQTDARRWAGRAELLINPGNLAWFEGTWALPQRLQVAQARALETRRPLLRTTNTGVTAHVDGHGQVVARLPLGAAGVLSGIVQPTAGLTPFARFGNVLVLCMAAVLLLLSILVDRLSTLRANASGAKS